MPSITLICAIAAIAGVVLLIRELSKPPDRARGRGWKAAALLVIVLATLAYGGWNAVIGYRRAQATKFLEHGRELVQRGAVDDAEKEFRRAAELDPDNTEATEELQQIEEARREAEERAAQGSGQVSPGGGSGAPGAARARTPPPPSPTRKHHPQRVESEIIINSYDLDVALDLDNHSIEGEAKLAIRSKGKRLKSFQISLSPKCNIEEITVDGQPAKTTTKGDWVDVEPQGRVSDQADSEVYVRYTGFGGDRVLPGGDLITREGSYLRAESRWYPAIGFLEFRSPVTVRVTVPGDYFAVGPGRLLSEKDTSDGQRAYEWRSSRKTAGICIAAAPWERLDGKAGGVPVTVLTFKTHKEKAQKILDQSEDVIEYFTDRFGEFPYEKLAIAEVPMFPGGYSPASLTLLGEPVYEGDAIFEHLLAHEIAHQWWGNQVLPQGPGAGWLAEGFAEYSHILYKEHAKGEEAFRRALWDAKQQYHLLQANPPEEPILETDPFDQQGSYIGVVYSKGAYLLHMLRYVIGDDAFFATLKGFLDDHRYGMATIEGFRAEAEKYSGRKLDWFFDQWLERPGTIELTYDWGTEQLDDGQYETTVVLDQQTDEPYQMPIDIRLVTATDKPLTTEQLTDTHHEYHLITRLPPRDIDIDPHDNLLMAVPKRVMQQPEQASGATPSHS